MHKGRTAWSAESDKRIVRKRVHGVDGGNVLHQLQRLLLRKCNRLPTEADSATHNGTVVQQLLVQCAGIQLCSERDDIVAVVAGCVFLRLLVLCDFGSHSAQSRKWTRVWRRKEYLKKVQSRQ